MIAIKAETKDKEKRQEQRYNCDAIIKWSYFNRRDFYIAEVKNLSTSGLYFVSSHPVLPSSTLVIRTENFNPNHSKTKDHIFLRTIYVADIKWCQEFVKNNLHYYGVGVRFNNQT